MSYTYIYIYICLFSYIYIYIHIQNILYIYINILMNDDDLTSFSVTETMGIGSVGIISKMAWKTQKLQTLELYGKHNRSPILESLFCYYRGHLHIPIQSIYCTIYLHIYIYMLYMLFIYVYFVYIYIYVLFTISICALCGWMENLHLGQESPDGQAHNRMVWRSR